MPDQIRARTSEIAPDCEIGPGVEIDADEVRIAPGCRIGFSNVDDFRTPPGVRIRCERLDLGQKVRIGRSVRMEGGTLRFDEGVRIERGATIRVLDQLHIGAFGTVHSDCEISGRSVEIGQELWMLPMAKIGGGSAFERNSRLEAGHYLHLGVSTLVNTARPVVIGHEVGLGTRTSIYTHGAYPSEIMGFPVAFAGVEIGDFTWVPGAIINPGVRIGRNCVIGVNSLVTKDVPDGSLAAGSPAAVIREGAYPHRLRGEKLLGFYERFFNDYATLIGSTRQPERDEGAAVVTLHADEVALVGALDPVAAERIDGLGGRVMVIADGLGSMKADEGVTLLDTGSRYITGQADSASETLTNELRRHGIRFYSRPSGGRYIPWEAQVPQH